MLYLVFKGTKCITTTSKEDVYNYTQIWYVTRITLKAKNHGQNTYESMNTLINHSESKGGKCQRIRLQSIKNGFPNSKNILRMCKLNLVMILDLASTVRSLKTHIRVLSSAMKFSISWPTRLFQSVFPQIRCQLEKNLLK